MKLLGYKRIHGTKKDGSGDYDFVQLYCQKSDEPMTAESGGIQLQMARNLRGFGLPSVDTNAFVQAMRAGVKVGEEIELFQDMEGHAVIRLMR